VYDRDPHLDPSLPQQPDFDYLRKAHIAKQRAGCVDCSLFSLTNLFLGAQPIIERRTGPDRSLWTPITLPSMKLIGAV
jgi:hypothetical protein